MYCISGIIPRSQLGAESLLGGCDKAMDYSAVRRLSLKVFLGFLGLTALIAIVSVLSGEWGKLHGKILATCFIVSGASICSMSCAAFIEKKRHVELGLAGIILSIVSALLLISGIWPEIDGEVYWKTTATLTVAAVSLAYTFLLLVPELDDSQKWVQWLFCVCVGVLALQIITAVWAEIHEEGYYRALAVVAILVGLQTLAIPIMLKLRKGSGPQKERLVLERLQGDTYRGPGGKRYRLREILSEEDG